MLTTYDVCLVMTTNPIHVNCDCGSYIVRINIYYREIFTVTSLLLKLLSILTCITFHTDLRLDTN